MSDRSLLRDREVHNAMLHIMSDLQPYDTFPAIGKEGRTFAMGVILRETSSITAPEKKDFITREVTENFPDYKDGQILRRAGLQMQHAVRRSLNGQDEPVPVAF